MIKLFRGIRRKLLKESKTYQYIIYAIGEIFLVVVGILLALWLNNLNRESKGVEVQIALLEEMKEDLSYDLIDFKGNINTLQGVSESIKVVLYKLDSKAPYSGSLDEEFAKTWIWPKAIIHSSTYEVLKTKGFELLSNPTLRREIIKMYDQNYKSLLYREIPEHREFFSQEMLSRFKTIKPWSYDSTGTFYIGRMKPNDYNSLTDDLAYKSMLRTIKNDSDYLLYKNYKRLVKEVNILIENIDKELIILRD